MEKYFVGLDVDDKAFHVTIVRNENIVAEFSCKPIATQLITQLLKIEKDKSKLIICYEACHFGFSLHRVLAGRGFDCRIVAPSFIPQAGRTAIKTDKVDSRNIALMLSKGLLTEIHIPQQHEEEVRNLLRSRHFLVLQRSSLKSHIVSQLRLHGYHYRQESGMRAVRYLSVRHQMWIQQKLKEHSGEIFRRQMQVLLNMFSAVTKEIEMLEDQITEVAESSLYKERKDSLLAFRGIDQITAMTLISEIGDVKRFAHPRSLTSYAGLDIREYSSGGRERKFTITKMGNSHIRRLLIESCQSADKPPRVSIYLKKRRADSSQAALNIADRCMSRLHKKSRGLKARGKHTNKVKVACAREMLCFVWEALQTVVS